MVKLFGVVVGHGRVFHVDLPLSETVSDLKEAIKAKNTDIIVCNANALDLYLARKHGRWLNIQDAEYAALENGEVLNDISTMMTAERRLRPLMNLSHSDCLGPRFRRRDGDVHVLVQMPASASVAAVQPAALDAATLEAIGAVVERVLTARDEKRSVRSMPGMDSTMEQRLVKKMCLKKKVHKANEPANSIVTGSLGTTQPATATGFPWVKNLAENEPSQRAAYMAYLTQHLAELVNGGDFSLADIAEDKHVLSCIDPRLPCDVTGTADVLLLHRRSPDPMEVLADVSVVIELKKKVERSHVPQALYQLTCCSIKAAMDCYPLELLTDLNSTWYFAWFDSNSTLATVTLQTPQNAFAFLKAFVRADPGPTPFHVPCVPMPIHKFGADDACPPRTDGNAEEMLERYELMADELDQEFLMARRAEYAKHLIQSMPAYAHMYT